MSTFNQLTTIDTNLLTDLTAEQSAIVEGGKTLKIYSIEAAFANADLGTADDTYIKVDSKKIWGEYSMQTGYKRTVNYEKPFAYSASIQLFDEDWGPDDYLGGFAVSRPTNGRAVAQVSGGGSNYNVEYEVFA